MKEIIEYALLVIVLYKNLNWKKIGREDEERGEIRLICVNVLWMGSSHIINLLQYITPIKLNLSDTLIFFTYMKLYKNLMQPPVVSWLLYTFKEDIRIFYKDFKSSLERKIISSVESLILLKFVATSGAIEQVFTVWLHWRFYAPAGWN